MKSYPTKYYIRFLTYLVFSLFILYYRIKKKLPSEVKKLKSPYLLLSNHVGFWDPFIAGHFLPKFTHFVSSDAAFRHKTTNFFLTRLGTIAKKKNMRDTQVIRDIISVIQQGENVGIFPEAVRNWAGSSFKMDKSIVKLIKLLDVPVVVSILKGMNLFNPRWSKKIRKTKVEVEYILLLNKEEVHKLSEEEIFAQLQNTLKHDEVAYQKKNKNIIHLDRKAEHINHALYLCPDCHAIDPFRVGGNSFTCCNCNYDIHINDYGFFERISPGKLHFDNIRDWYYWQEKYLLEDIQKKFEIGYQDCLFEDKGSKIYYGKEDADLQSIGQADVKLFMDRIDLCFQENSKQITFNFNDLQAINPQVHERLEIYYKNEPYRIIGSREGVSALKWEVAVNAIWKKLGQENKLSPYINM
ncbi:MAG: 1-acyl-sn-glycerol-3-phosphate acyltransferase [Bacteroidetes bacterium]|nr:1-acyl-sn-glycerol-3-phosphate acyltransferase [Bacteroidota bacterium]